MILKARIKRVGCSRVITHRWVNDDTKFIVVRTDNPKDPQQCNKFEMFVDSTHTVNCLRINCLYLGGNDAEWELFYEDEVQVNTDAAYDRAMGVL